jgi:hypothetical protein
VIFLPYINSFAWFAHGECGKQKGEERETDIDKRERERLVKTSSPTQKLPEKLSEKV